MGNTLASIGDTQSSGRQVQEEVSLGGAESGVPKRDSGALGGSSVNQLHALRGVSDGTSKHMSGVGSMDTLPRWGLCRDQHLTIYLQDEPWSSRGCLSMRDVSASILVQCLKFVWFDRFSIRMCFWSPLLLRPNGRFLLMEEQRFLTGLARSTNSINFQLILPARSRGIDDDGISCGSHEL